MKSLKSEFPISVEIKRISEYAKYECLECEIRMSICAKYESL